MKNSAKLLAALLLVTACNSVKEDQYEVTVRIEGLEDGKKAYLQKPVANSQPIVLDTLEVTNGMFTFSGSAATPELHFLFFEGVRGGLPIILEEGSIEVEAYKDSLNFSKLAGTPSNEDFTSFMENSRAIRQKMGDIQQKAMEAQRSQDTVTLNVLSETFKEVQEEAKTYETTFVQEHPDSYMSLLILQQMLNAKSRTPEEVSELFKAMNPALQETAIGKELKETLSKFTNLSVGAVAPDFSGPTPDGTQLSLKESLGKLTILDFWAGWCKPCRIENPNLVALYEAYKDKGLSVVGVSLDRTREEWTNAIAEDQLPWNHVSNLQFWQDPIARLYNITAIPATFLLDEEGRIIAKDLRGEALEAKVAEVLGE